MNKYKKNLLYLASNRSLMVFCGGLFTVFLAQNLSEKQFGEFSLAQALILVGISVSAFGMEGVVNQKAAKDQFDGFNAWFHAFIMQLVLSIFSVALIYIMLFKLNIYSELKYFFILFIAPLIIIRSTLSVKYYFDGIAHAGSYSLMENIILTIGFSVKILFLSLSVSMSFILLAFVVEALLIGLLLLAKIYRQHPSILTLQKIEFISLIKTSFPFFISGLAVILYIRMDIAFVEYFIGFEAVGNYALASRLVEIFYIVPSIYISAKITKIVMLYEGSQESFKLHLNVVNSTLFYSALILSIAIMLVSDKVISFVFKGKYTDAYSIVNILCFSLIPVFCGNIVGRFFLLKGRPWLILINTFCGLGCNFFLNFILVPIYGVQGAAFSTVASQIFSNFIINLFSSCGRELFNAQLSGILTPKKIVKEIMYFRG